MFKNSKEKSNDSTDVEKMYNYQRKTFEGKLEEQQLKIDEIADFISERFGEDVANSNMATKLKKIEENLRDIETKYKINLDKIEKTIKKEIEEEGKKITSKLSDSQTESYIELLKKNDEEIEKITDIFIQKDEDISELNNVIKEHIKQNEEYIKEVQGKFKETNQKISKINYLGISSKFDKKLKEECSKIDDKLEEINKQIKFDFSKQDEKISKDIAISKDEIKSVSNLVNNVDLKLSKELETVYGNIESTASLASTIDEKVSVINSIQEDMKKEIEQLRKRTEEEYDKKKNEINEQIVNNKNVIKKELENISETVENIKYTVGNSIDNIGQEIFRLTEETKTNLEQQEKNNTDIELLKKDYTKYVTKMNNELAKMSKSILNAQKINLETNQNLQIKIKAYIDNKFEKSNNTQKIEELINKLDLSIKEQEKLNKLEMEEMLNKKLKVIQKENERLLNKRIEEMASKLIRENMEKKQLRPIDTTINEGVPKNKKNMYELIDKNEMIKRSATSKNHLSTSQEGRSQILKFFYDDEGES